MTIYQLLTLISALTTSGLFFHAFKMRKNRGALTYSVLMLLITLSAVSTFFELITEGINQKFLWRRISESIALLIFPTILLMVLKFTKSKILKKPVTIFCVFLLPTGSILLIWADRIRYLMRQDIFLESCHLVIIRTPLGKAIAMANYAIAIAAIILLILFYNKTNREYRKQAVGFIVGIFVPLVITSVKEASHQMAQILPPPAVALTITGVLTFWSFFKYRFFSIVPVARDQVMESIQEGVLVVDGFGTVIDKNAAVDRFIFETIGKQYNIIHKNVDKLLYTWPQWLASCRNMIEGEYSIDTSKWNAKRYFLVKVYPMFGGSTKKVGTVSIILDITEVKMKKEKLKEATKLLSAQNAIKDKLIEVVTHDIRNPIATMVSLMELLEGESENFSNDSREIVSEAREQIDYTYNLVESMLQWLRNNKDGFSYNPLIYELSKVTQETICVIQTKAVSKGIQLINGIEESTTIFADRDMVGLVLRNLLYNAVKFTNSGGFISIKARQAEQKVIVEVQDSGIGMEPDKVNKLFKEEYINSTMGTSGEKGTGLGLLICKDFVQCNGGEIWVESVQGKGSTFYFSLPAQENRNIYQSEEKEYYNL